MPFEENLAARDDEFSSLSLPEVPGGEQFQSMTDDSDESLLDLGDTDGHITPTSGCGRGSNSTLPLSNDAAASAGFSGMVQGRHGPDSCNPVSDSLSLQEVVMQANVKDLVLGGTEAALGAPLEELDVQARNTDGNLASTQEQAKNSSLVSTSEHVDKGTLTPAAITHTACVTAEEKVGIGELLLQGDKATTTTTTTIITGPPCAAGEPDNLFNEWNQFSSFMPTTRDDTPSPLAGWEEEFGGTASVSPAAGDSSVPSESLHVTRSTDSIGVLTPVASTSSLPPATSADPLMSNHSNSASAVTHDDHPVPTLDLDELLGLGPRGGVSDSSYVTLSCADKILSEELRALDISPPSMQLLTNDGKMDGSQVPHAPQHVQGSNPGMESINPAVFQAHAQNHPPPPMHPINSTGYPLLGQHLPQMFHSPLSTSQAPPTFLSHVPMGVVMPPRFGLSPGGIPMAMSGFQPPVNLSGTGIGQRVKRDDAGKDDNQEKTAKDRGKSLMNVFAHLDPLVNEKA